MEDTLLGTSLVPVLRVVVGVKLHVFSEVLFWSIAVFGSMIMSFHHGPAGLVQSHLVFRLTTETV